MSFRYGYTVNMMTGATMDENGDPVVGADVTFMADYQPTVSNTQVNYNGSFVNVSYKLYVDPKYDTVIAIGNDVECNGTKGVVVAVYPTKLNTEIWVK
jgi:hypothetical protein